MHYIKTFMEEKYKIPSDWQIRTINEVCNIYTGNSINKKRKRKIL